MILQFWGAAQTVTGSMHLVEADGHRLLLDCGMAQGRREEAKKLNSEFPFDPEKIDAVVLSHAHLDHSGKLPMLVKKGFSGSIFSTSATRDLCSAMLADSASLQEMDAKYVNRQNEKQGLPFIKPLYTLHDVARTMRLFQTVEFQRPLEILPGIKMTFRNAGHILGSASVSLEIAEGRDKKKVTALAFTGADHDKVGLFVEANHSTILLDEIADIPVSIQTKLLRVLQERQVTPLGTEETHAVDFQLISASHQHLPALVREGRFREDLYYRLNVFHIHLPPLRERREDVPLFVAHFLARFAAENHRSPRLRPAKPDPAA